MGWLCFLKSDPSESWPQVRMVPLTLDLGDMSLNQIKIGDKPEALISFGKPSNKRPFKNKLFQYDNLGCLLEIYEGVIGYFAVGIQPDDYTDFGPVELKIISPNGKSIYVNKATTEQQIHGLLGLPLKEDIDDYEMIDFYKINRLELEVEYVLVKTVKRINLYQKH